MSKLKCSNINLNLNSIDFSVGTPSLPAGDNIDVGGDSSAPGAESLAASGLMNDGRDGKKGIIDKRE